MSMATVGALRVTLGLNSATFTEGLTAAQKHLRGVSRQMQSVGTGIATVGAGMTAAITLPALAMGRALMQGATSAAHAAGQVQAALASMGDRAGRSFDQLTGQAERLSATSLFDDDEILTKVTANLLTFGNIAGSAFDRAQQAAVNLSAGLRTDLQSSTMMLGKALDNPVRGMNALTRAGVSLSPAIQQNIKDLVAQGRTLEAQSIILDAVESQFRNRGLEARKADPMAAAMIDLGRAMGTLEQHFVPVIAGIAGVIQKVSAFLGALEPAQAKVLLIGVAIAAVVGPALVAVGAVVSAIGVMLPLLGAIGLPFLAIAAAVAAVGVAFWAFRDDIMPVLKVFGAEVQRVLGPELKEMFAAIREAVSQVGASFRTFIESDAGKALVAFSVMMQRTMGGVVINVLKALLQYTVLVVKGITTAFNVVSALLRGDWSGAWVALKTGVGGMLASLGAAVASFSTSAVKFIGDMVNGVARWLTGKLFDVLKGVIDKVKGVSDAFFRLYDAVVGNSYVPDMVEGIAHWMGKLDAGMVSPARNATDATREAFETLRDDVATIFDGLLTDSERATRQLARDMATLDKALAQNLITRTEYEQARGGVAAEGLEPGRRLRVNPLGTEATDIAASIREGLEKSRAALDETAEHFAGAFAYNMEGVLRGDIKGVFLDILGDMMNSLLRDIGKSLFHAMGGGKGGDGSFLSSIFGAMGLPGFKTGGSFKVGGSGGADSQTVAFRATPGEMVDIRRPGQDAGTGGMVVQVNPSPYFDVQVERVATPIAGRAAFQSFGAARQQVPADQARRNRFSLTGAR